MACFVALQSEERTFSTALDLLCAWACCGVSLPGETPEPPFSAALGLTAALGFLVRVCVLCVSKSGLTPELFLCTSLCYSHTCQHTAISIKRRGMLPYSKLYRRATLRTCGT